MSELELREKNMVLLVTRRNDWYINLTLAGTGRGGGVDATPCGFSGISFLFTGRMSPIFIKLTEHFFTSLLKISRP